MVRHKEYYKGGRWWFPPSPGPGESCESMFACGSSVHQKCSNYALTNLLFGFCRSVWVIELLVPLPSPYPRAPACLLPLKCCESGSVPQLFILPLFSHLDSQLSLPRNLGVRQATKATLELLNGCNIKGKLVIVEYAWGSKSPSLPLVAKQSEKALIKPRKQKSLGKNIIP